MVQSPVNNSYMNAIQKVSSMITLIRYVSKNDWTIRDFCTILSTVLALNSVNGFTKHPELLNISCGPEFFWAFAMLKISDVIAPDLINISIY